MEVIVIVIGNFMIMNPVCTDSKQLKNREVGAGIVGENVNLKGTSATVNVLRLSDFVLNVVAQRRVPEPEQGPI